VSAPLLVVDTPFFLYRAFYSVPEKVRLNALLGTANAVLRVVEERKPRAVAMCFGPDAAPYRVELLPAYHAHRPPVPHPLAEQFNAAPVLFREFGWECLYDESVEADDLLHSLAHTEEDAGGKTLIMTGDRDMFQCVNPDVLVLLVGRGGEVEVDEKEVKTRYGIPPSLVPDFIALRGDPSDGIPGLKGVGPKTAAEILNRHGSLEAAVEASEKLAAHRDELLAYKDIAKLRDVPVERPPDRPTDFAAGAVAAKACGMNGLARRLDALTVA
jgi:DNA polymerase-1